MAGVAESSLACLNAAGQGGRVVFEKCGDRFEHSIYRADGNEATLLYSSVEGTPDEFFPASPPFAELHQQDDIFFLSGATTIGHWSMSVQSVEGRLLFDVACRLKSEPAWLGSTYRVATPDGQLQPAEATGSLLEQNLLRLAPTSTTTNNYPATLQWQYSLACT